jgi:hypothetical protein
MKRLRPSLESLLTVAIHIRRLSLVGNERYESVWPCIGSQFDDSEMETATAAKRPIATVQWPICPGLRAYPTEGNAVSHKGFVTRRELQEPMKYVIKALVCGGIHPVEA